MLKIASLLLFSLIFINNSYSQDKPDEENQKPNDLNEAKIPGKIIREVGPYKLIFYVSKNWKRLRLEIQDKKGNTHSIKDTTFNVSVRPSNRKLPFKVAMTKHSPEQQGVFISSHYIGNLKFIDEFSSFIVSMKININGRICSVETNFSK